MCVFYADLSSYAFLVYQLLCGEDNNGGTEGVDAGECEGFNLANFSSASTPPAIKYN